MGMNSNFNWVKSWELPTTCQTVYPLIPLDKHEQFIRCFFFTKTQMGTCNRVSVLPQFLLMKSTISFLNHKFLCLICPIVSNDMKIRNLVLYMFQDLQKKKTNSLNTSAKKAQ